MYLMLKNKAKKELATFYRKSVERKLRTWIKNEDEKYISCESKNLTSIGINILNIKFWNHKKVLFSYAHFVFQKNKTPQCYLCIHAKHILFIKKPMYVFLLFYFSTVKTLVEMVTSLFQLSSHRHQNLD